MTKTTDLLATLGSKVAQRKPVVTEIIHHRPLYGVTVPAADLRYTAENPAYPWEPAAPLDAPGIDCTILDRGREP